MPVLNDAMKALTTRKPIALTTTSLCSGAFTARIARTQRLHVLRVAGSASPGWDGVERSVNADLFKKNGMDVQTTTFPDATAAAAALSEGSADIAFTDTVTAIQVCGRLFPMQLIAISSGLDYCYIGLAAAIAAKRYPMTRFARALRENAKANYVDASELQTLVDRLAAEKLIDTRFDVSEHISTVAVLSGTR